MFRESLLGRVGRSSDAAIGAVSPYLLTNYTHPCVLFLSFGAETCEGGTASLPGADY